MLRVCVWCGGERRETENVFNDQTKNEEKNKETEKTCYNYLFGKQKQINKQKREKNKNIEHVF